MRIAVLTEKFPPEVGGLAVSVQRLAQGLARAGHEVELFVLSEALKPGQSEEKAQDGLIVHRLGAHRRSDEALGAWFQQVMARHAARPFDLLHGYFLTRAGFIAAYAGNVLGVPSVVSARGNDLDRALFDPAKAAHILYALQSASAVTTNACDLQRKAGALAPGREVTLIPNGVDATHFTPAPRDEALAASLCLGEVPVLGFVGEARAKKGLAPLLLAYREVAAQRPAALLLVGGPREGEDETMVKLFRKQNPDLPLVIVPPQPLAAMPPYYRLLDLLLLPSLQDGLPNALLEGMACECAIIGTTAGGLPDALRDGATGRLVPPGDVPALVAAIHALLDDAARRQQLGRAARATVLDTFPIEKEIDANLRLYERLLPAPSPSSRE